MNYSFHYLVYQNRDYSKHDIYTKLFAFIFSIIPTWVLLNFTKASANMVTFAGLLFGIAGAVLGTIYGLEYLLFGFLIFLILDFVDGNIASAKGGGSYKGAIYDMLADRTTLFLSVLTLVNYHLNNNQKEEVLLVLTYLIGFLFLDVLALAIFGAKKSYNIHPAEVVKGKRGPNNFKKIISDPLIWLPTRISSYILIILTFLISSSFIYAYLVGILCILSAYLTTILNSNKRKEEDGES